MDLNGRRRVHKPALVIASCLVIVAAAMVPASAVAITSTIDAVRDMRNELVGMRPSIDRSFSYAFFYDFDKGKLELDTDAPIKVFAGIASKYADLVEIRTATLAVVSGRLADTTPFYGGAAINDGTGLCSSGYLAKSSTKTYMVTAGHCFPLNATIHANRFASQGQVMGTVTARDFPAYESELISGGSYSPRIYNGANGDNTSSVPIKGQKLDVRGTSGYCRTGQTTGNSCGWTLNDTNATFCTSDWCSDYLNAYNGGTSPQGGDSGGPIYYPYNGGALMAGTITGYSCVLIFCTYYGEKVGSILGRWNLTLVCSGTCALQ